jgi:hypothetical protein
MGFANIFPPVHEGNQLVCCVLSFHADFAVDVEEKDF